LKKSLSLTQQAYIKALGLTGDIFTSGKPPPFEKKMPPRCEKGCGM
jgi:hypothetical protein